MQGADEVGFRAGDMIQVLDKKSDWWKGTVDGNTGL